MPTDFTGQPLDELKQWLAISTAQDDALLLRLLDTAGQLCTRFTGLAPAAWAELPEGVRHGIVRFAAHLYRERDAAEAPLPLAVAALWRPYRMVRL